MDTYVWSLARLETDGEIPTKGEKQVIHNSDRRLFFVTSAASLSLPGITELKER